MCHSVPGIALPGVTNELVSVRRAPRTEHIAEGFGLERTYKDPSNQPSFPHPPNRLLIHSSLEAVIQSILILSHTEPVEEKGFPWKAVTGYLNSLGF